MELGQLRSSNVSDGVLIAYGTLSPPASRPQICCEKGIEVGVINARFAKPLDRQTLLRCVEQLPLVVTVEEGTLEGGFGSALLEAANSAGLATNNVVRLGIPDRFIEHAERAELLADLGLDANGIAQSVLTQLGRADCDVADSGWPLIANLHRSRVARLGLPQVANENSGDSHSGVGISSALHSQLAQPLGEHRVRHHHRNDGNGDLRWPWWLLGLNHLADRPRLRPSLGTGKGGEEGARSRITFGQTTAIGDVEHRPISL